MARDLSLSDFPLPASASVYIVEDEPLIAENARIKLGKLGYTVLHVSSTGEDALDRIPQLRPDVVLMDIKLAGELDGMQTAAQVLHHYSVPILFTTAYSDEATLTKVKALSPYGYILKPYNISDLRTNIEVALQRFRKDLAVQKQSHERAVALRNYLEVEEAERNQLAESLHEQVGQLLSAAKLHLQALHPPQEEVRHLQQAQELLNEAILRVRRMSHQVLPNLLRDFGLDASLAAYLNELQAQNPHLLCKLELVRLHTHFPPEQAYGLYRLYQEVLGFALGLPKLERLQVYLEEETQIRLTFRVLAKSVTDPPPDLAALRRKRLYRALDARVRQLQADMELGQHTEGWLQVEVRAPI